MCVCVCNSCTFMFISFFCYCFKCENHFCNVNHVGSYNIKRIMVISLGKLSYTLTHACTHPNKKKKYNQISMCVRRVWHAYSYVHQANINIFCCCCCYCFTLLWPLVLLHQVAVERMYTYVHMYVYHYHQTGSVS